MDISTIVRKNTLIQNQSVNNLFDSAILFQKSTERILDYWSAKMGVDKQVQTEMDQFWATLIGNVAEGKNAFNDCVSAVDAILGKPDSKRNAVDPPTG
jgi:hypothetical protein